MIKSYRAAPLQMSAEQENESNVKPGTGEDKQTIAALNLVVKSPSDEIHFRARGSVSQVQVALGRRAAADS